MSTYTIEEFVEDCRALLGKRPTDYQMDDEEGWAFDAKIAQIGDYMKSKYPRGRESVFRAARFMQALDYLGRNKDAFDRGDYAVFGSDEVGGLVGEHVMRALHSFYMMDKPARTDPDPETVMKLATALKEAADG